MVFSGLVLQSLFIPDLVVVLLDPSVCENARVWQRMV